MRPALVFQRDAGSEIARYFLGPFVPTRLLRRVPLPVLPLPERLRFQVVHADDLADALVRILERAPGGAFNVADEPVLRGRDLALSLNAPRWFPVNRRVVRAAADLTYRAHVHPVQPDGWTSVSGSPSWTPPGHGRSSGGVRFTRPATCWWNCWTASATTPGHRRERCAGGRAW